MASEKEKEFLDLLQQVYERLREEKKSGHNRSLSFGDYFTDRWKRAAFDEFGEGTSVYDNVLVLGNVSVGRNCWIGPNCILDGTGGLTIGDHCDISAGVHIYTHHTVRRAVSMGKEPIAVGPTRIGNGVYIGPNSVVSMGVTIADQCVVGAMSFVDKDVPARSKVHGCPAAIVGTVEV
jgi:acetyltransferase-like isoleucine patch superfamily enzyme